MELGPARFRSRCSALVGLPEMRSNFHFARTSGQLCSSPREVGLCVARAMGPTHYAGRFADPVVPPPARTRRTTSLVLENHELAPSSICVHRCLCMFLCELHRLNASFERKKFNTARGMMERKQRARRTEFDGHCYLQLAAQLARMRDVSSR